MALQDGGKAKVTGGALLVAVLFGMAYLGPRHRYRLRVCADREAQRVRYFAISMSQAMAFSS